MKQILKFYGISNHSQIFFNRINIYLYQQWFEVATSAEGHYLSRDLRATTARSHPNPSPQKSINQIYGFKSAHKKQVKIYNSIAVTKETQGCELGVANFGDQ